MVTGPNFVTLNVDPIAGVRAKVLDAIQPMLDANQAMARKVLADPALQATMARVAEVYKPAFDPAVMRAVEACKAAFDPAVMRVAEAYMPVLDPVVLRAAEAFKPAFDPAVLRVAEMMAPVIDASRFSVAQAFAFPTIDTSWIAEAIRPAVEATRFAESFRPTFERLLADMFDPDMFNVDLWDVADDPSADDTAADLAGVQWWLRTWDGMTLGEQLVAVTALVVVLYLSAYATHAALDPTVEYNPAAALAELAQSLIGNIGASVLVTIVMLRRMGK